MLEIAVIGFGLRTETLLKNLVVYAMPAKITAVYDRDKEKAKERLVASGFDLAGVLFFDNVHDMLANKRWHGIFIGTNCESHAYYAKLVLSYKTPLFIEKPVAISLEQVNELEKAYKKYQSNTLVSFPLRFSLIVQEVKQLLDKGAIGEIVQIQAVNNVSYGRVYYKSWYRNEELTGGLFLQKATHDVDYINYLMGSQPVEVCAMESKVFFKGKKPAALRCEECGEQRYCSESPHTIKYDYEEEALGDYCSFAVDTGNHDNASLIIRYSDGRQAVYTQNFVVRKAAGKRGATIIGYDGTLEFDFVKDCIKVYSHKTSRIETIQLDTKELAHFGGDKRLCDEFVAMMQGKNIEKGNLEDGILSVKTCLLARQSAQKHQFYSMAMFEEID